MKLSGKTLHTMNDDPTNEFTVRPFVPENVQPAGIDLRLDSIFARLQRPGGGYYLPVQWEEFVEEKTLLLWPGECVLGATIEHVTLPVNMFGNIDGRSTCGRMFTQVHMTAGNIDPGFSGVITLEIKNSFTTPVEIDVGANVCQLWCGFVQGEPASYQTKRNSHYTARLTKQRGPTLPVQTSGIRMVGLSK